MQWRGARCAVRPLSRFSSLAWQKVLTSGISLGSLTFGQMPFVKLVKNKAYHKRFQVKYRRRRGTF